jgi:hypothetical protein
VPRHVRLYEWCAIEQVGFEGDGGKPSRRKGQLDRSGAATRACLWPDTYGGRERCRAEIPGSVPKLRSRARALHEGVPEAFEEIELAGLSTCSPQHNPRALPSGGQAAGQRAIRLSAFSPVVQGDQ